jgi:hypothetical protein
MLLSSTRQRLGGDQASDLPDQDFSNESYLPDRRVSKIWRHHQRWSYFIEEVDYCCAQDAACVRNMASASLFVVDCPGIGSGGSGVDTDLLSGTLRLFRIILKALRRRGSTKNSLNTARKAKLLSGNALPQVVRNLVKSRGNSIAALQAVITSQTRVCSCE